MKKLLLPNKFNLEKFSWLIFFICFAPLFIFAYFKTIPAEDAVILYEYAKNLALNGVITYGGSTAPIEGATDFLWMIIIAALKWLGIDEFISALFLNFIGLILIVRLFKDQTEKLLLYIAILLTPYLYASLFGFSAIFFSAIYLLSIKLLLERSKYLYLSLLILCLVRPDGVVWGAGCVIVRMFQVKDRDSFEDEVKQCALWLIAPGLIYFFWRLWYFQEIFPLPFIVKSTSVRDLLFFYRDSITSIYLVAVPLVFTLIAFARKKDIFFFIALLGIPIFFYSAMKLEQNIGNRFMAPIFFVSLFLISQKYGWRALLLFALISISMQFKSAVGTASSLVFSSLERVYYLSKDLSSLKGRMLITEAGRLTYYSNWFSEDSWGLNTPRYAKKLINKTDIELGEYNLIVAHCDISMLHIDSDLSHNQSRTWNNQCKELTSFIRENKFEVFLVPFSKQGSIKERLKLVANIKQDKTVSPQRCNRHDIYAVSKQYKQSDDLISILQNNGAVRYSEKLITQGDALCSNLNLSEKPNGNRP